MATMYEDVYVRCPFFHCGDERKISCEGITDGCITTLEFNSKEKKRLHRRIFCNERYTNCEIYRMLEEIYEDE